jgi:hypothetical protein
MVRGHLLVCFIFIVFNTIGMATDSFGSLEAGPVRVLASLGGRAVDNFNGIFQTSIMVSEIEDLRFGTAIMTFIGTMCILTDFHANASWVYAYYLFFWWAFMFRKMFDTIFEKMRTKGTQNTLEVNVNLNILSYLTYLFVSY